MKVNISTKTKAVGVEYVPFKKITLEGEDKVFTKIAEKEVGKVKNIQKIKKVMQTVATVTGVSLSLGTRAFASGVKGATPLLNPLSPDLVMYYGTQLAFISISVAVSLAMILLTAAGVLMMLKKRQESMEMSTDIIKGLVQVLISIPSVYLVYKVASYVFRNLNFLSLGF